jgi:hypothetical protein
MSEEHVLPILAAIGFNEGANKGFWRVQPREKFGEDAGQWIEMGAELRLFYKNERGETANVTGRAVGSTGTPDGVRVLVQGQSEDGVPDGIYGAKTSDVRVAEGFIPEEVLKEQGIENTVNISKEQEAALPTLESLERVDITDEDLRLINEGINSKEAKEHAEYKKTVEAEESSAKTSAPKAKRIVKASRKAVEEAPEGAEFFYSRGGKLHQLHVRDDGYLYKGPYVEGKEGGEDDFFGSYDDIFEANKTGRGPGSLYKGSIPRDENFNKLDSIQFRNLLSEQESNKKTEVKSPGSTSSDDLFRLPDPDPDKIRRPYDGSGRFTRDEKQKFVEVSRKTGKPIPDSDEKEKDSADIVIKDLMGDVAFGDDIPDLDSLIDSSKNFEGNISAPGDLPSIDKLITPKKPKQKEAPVKPATKKRYPIELEPGMVVRDKGANFVVQDTPKPVGSTKDGIVQLTGFNVIEEGKKEVRFVRVDRSEPLDVLVGSDNKTPIKRDVVSPSVSTPSKPETPTKPDAPKPPSPRKNRIRDLLKKRKDDGKDIAPSAKSREELQKKKIKNRIDPNSGDLLYVEDADGKPRTIGSLNAIEDGLLEEIPDAKVTPDGAIITERGTFVDTDGKTYRYETRVERTRGYQFMERYIFSDPETGEVLYDYYNHDYKDSFAGLFGKSNGLVVTRDYFLGRRVPGFKGTDADGVPIDDELKSYFGPDKTIENRINFLLKKSGQARVPRIITPDNLRNRFLVGHGRVVNTSDSPTGQGTSTYGTIARSFVPDIYEIIAGGDNELMLEAYLNAMGRFPDTEADKTALLKSLSAGLRERFSSSPDYGRIAQIPNQLGLIIFKEGLDIRNRQQVPFVSQDGVTPLIPGRYVEFYQNENESSIGRVVRLIDGSGKNGGYKDTVAVQFKDKIVPNLQTRNMRPLTDEELDLTVIDNDDLLTEYVGQLQGEEMVRVRLPGDRRPPSDGADSSGPPPPPTSRRARPNSIKVVYDDLANRKEDSPDREPDDVRTSGDAASPYIGEAGVEGNSENVAAPSGTRAEDLSTGDPIYDENGELLGNILAIEEVPSADGGENGYAITYESPDGEEEVVVLDAGEVRGPK